MPKKPQNIPIYLNFDPSKLIGWAELNEKDCDLLANGAFLMPTIMVTPKGQKLYSLSITPNAELYKKMLKIHQH